MSSASTTTGVSGRSPGVRREATLLLIASALAAFVGYLLEKSLLFYELVELAAICFAGGVAAFNYFRIDDSLAGDNVLESEIRECRATVRNHRRLVILLFVACYFTVLVRLPAFVLPLLLAFIYLTYILSNLKILELIARGCAGSEAWPPTSEQLSYNYTVLAANHLYFYREENSPSLFAYALLAGLCSLIPIVVALGLIDSAPGLKPLAAGAALFHLGLSGWRFRRIFTSSDDAIERLVRMGIHKSGDKKNRLRLKGACEESSIETQKDFERWIVFSLIVCVALGLLASAVGDVSALS